MEAPAKRQKLNTQGDETHAPSALPRPKTTTAASSRLSAGTEPASNGTGATAAHAAWIKAKALSQTRRGKKLEFKSSDDGRRGVYDDYEGAHAHQSPLKRSAPAFTPTKKHLDPLRNQQNAAPTASPAKSRVSLDFFKQFSSPKPASESTPVKSGSKTAKDVNGTRSHAIGGEEAEADAAAEVSSDISEDNEEDDVVVQDSPSSKAKGKGWAYEKPKKTFEDEIRELEQVARQEADQDDDADASQRRSGRAVKTTLRHAASMDLAKRARPTIQKPAQPPKPSAARTTKQTEAQAEQDPDAMDIDEPAHDDDQPEVTAQLHNEDISVVTPTKAKPQATAPILSSRKDATFSQEHISAIQNIVLEKLMGKRAVRLANLDDEYAKVSNLITQTVTAGESNSMLVIGARGSGKTALVSQILREQTSQNADDFHVVCLSGFIHTDDKVALREIWRQLGREMELEDDEGVSKNYADTMTRLLALLSHPVEQESEVTKSVIFILDEFELFASHPRQTLLYNLFDIAQSRKAPIAVLGLTTRIDVAESLEKRVKSRFSHRYVHLSSAKSFAAFQDACRSALVIDPKELSAEERELFGPSSQLTAKLEKSTKKDDKNSLTNWNSLIDDLLAHEDILHHLKRIYYTTKSIPEFHTSMLLPFANLPTTSSTTTTETLLDHIPSTLATNSLRPADSKLAILHSLSTLHLALLICAARLTNIHNADTVPFAQAYDEYKVLASKAKLQATASGALAQGAGSRVSTKEAAKGAWEDLVEVGLVMEDGGRGGRVDVGLEEIGGCGVELGSWGRWCREI